MKMEPLTYNVKIATEGARRLGFSTLDSGSLAAAWASVDRCGEPSPLPCWAPRRFL